VCFGEVQYYFRVQPKDHSEPCRTLAMLSLYSPPDEDLFEQLYGAVWSCMYLGQGSLVVVDAVCIQSVVAIIPFPHTSPRNHRGQVDGPFYVVEKMG
ncbi:hypothetical protein OF83DRAFT_1033854, partial [Amylostereum chailletii]